MSQEKKNGKAEKPNQDQPQQSQTNGKVEAGNQLKQEREKEMWERIMRRARQLWSKPTDDVTKAKGLLDKLYRAIQAKLSKLEEATRAKLTDLLVKDNKEASKPLGPEEVNNVIPISKNKPQA